MTTDLTSPDLAAQTSPPPHATIRVNGLSKAFGELEAVKQVSFDVSAGESFAFLGPNGAGKSTTIRMLCTLSQPTSGSARVAGYDVVRQPRSVRSRIGLVFQDQTLDEQLTAEENLEFHAVLYGVPRDELDNRISRVLDLVGLAERRTDLVQDYSGGMSRRLEIARALLHTPEVLFLDEPTVGLDPQTRARMWEDVLRLRDEEGVTVFFTTHYMDEAEYAERIAIIDHGEIVALDSPTALKAVVGKDSVRLSTADDEAAAQQLRSLGFDAVSDDNGVTIRVDDGESAVPGVISSLDVAVRQVSVHKPDLDDVFMQFTGREIRADSGPSMSLARRFVASRRR